MQFNLGEVVIYRGNYTLHSGKNCIIRHLTTPSSRDGSCSVTLETLDGTQFTSRTTYLQKTSSIRSVYTVKQARSDEFAACRSTIYATEKEAIARAEELARTTGKEYYVLKAVALVAKEEPPVKVVKL